MSTLEKQVVLVTGCSTGIGRALVRELSARGHRPIASARRLDAIADLAADGIDTVSLDVKDLASIGAAVKLCSGRVVTIEDHQVIGGMGAQISHALARGGIPHRMKSLGIQGEFGQSAYLAEELYQKHGLTAQKLIEAAMELTKS